MVVQQLLGENPDIEVKDDVSGQSPLAWAAENGHEAIVNLLLERNAQLESRNHYGQTPLWLAARYGHFYVDKLLAERNAIIDAEDNISRTPLSIAEFHEHNGVSAFLLRQLAKQRAKGRKFTWKPIYTDNHHIYPISSELRAESLTVCIGPLGSFPQTLGKASLRTATAASIITSQSILSADEDMALGNFKIPN